MKPSEPKKMPPRQSSVKMANKQQTQQTTLQKRTSMNTTARSLQKKTSGNQIKPPLRKPYGKTQLLPEKDWRLDWAGLPDAVYIQVFQYVCRTVWDVFKLTHVCRRWRMSVQSPQFSLVWQRLKVKNQIKNTKQLAALSKEIWISSLIKSYSQFEKTYVRLFDYGSTKENIANKLIARLGLQIHLRINKVVLENIQYKLRTFNFSSYLVFKCTDIANLKFDFTTAHNMFKDKIDLQVTFESKKYKASYKIKKQYIPQEIHQKAIRQKAFNYFLDKNLVLTFFEGDDHFLYLLSEISAIELVTQFRRQIKRQEKLRQLELLKQKKKVLQDYAYESFSQYFRMQMDFEVHLSFHNSQKQIFTHCDTKVYPVQYDDKSAYFRLEVKDSFPIQKTFKLDNKMGMSEPVENLYLLDLVLKDRDRFLITFSGFIYGRRLSEQEKSKLDNYLRLSEMPVFELAFSCPRYNFTLTIIEQKTRYFLPNLILTLYPQR